MFLFEVVAQSVKNIEQNVTEGFKDLEGKHI